MSTTQRRTLTQLFWDFDLCDDLLRSFAHAGVEAVPGTLEGVRALFSQQFTSFTQEGLGLVPRPNVAAAKRRYLEEACDLIELRKDGESIGCFVGGPEDWSACYLRSMCILPAFQRMGLAKRLLAAVISVVQARGIERVTGETSPVNTT